MPRRGWVRSYAPLLGFVYVPLGLLALALGGDHKGAARAIFGKTSSVAFSMKPVPDFLHKPFG